MRIARVSPVSGSNSTVACWTVPPSSIRSICHWTSKSIACCRNLKLFRFLISRRVPNGAPGRRTETLASQRNEPFLHVAVADAEPDDERVQRAGVGDRLGARAHVGLGDDLQQRRAGAVQVDAGLAVVVLVQRLAGVFLEVGARQVHACALASPTKNSTAPPCTTGISYWLIW